MPQTHLMLLWHHHQPFYKDLAEERYAMPWVRLHALKDYYGMVAMLREFPSVHMTFNLVPSLLMQLEDYAQDRAREEAYELAFKPAEELSAEERERLLYFAFQVNRENLLYRYPRFRELYEKAKPWELGSSMASLFTAGDLRDLQVLSQLAWFDEIYLARDPVIHDLAAQARGYTEEDKSILRNKEIELVQAVLEEHREAQARGQVELSTSPFYHPILPLLCDTDVGTASHPGLPLPRRSFRHPEDARAQLQNAIKLHERVFGRRPRGLWPSEGSVSDEVLRLAAEEGFAWAATDEGVLSRSLGIAFSRQSDGTTSGGGELYRPHRFVSDELKISLFFRDHLLSDRIGFVYSRMEAHTAAADLHARIRSAGRSTGDRATVVSIVLDGENAWEFYAGNGREFLKSFYSLVAQDPDLRSMTASEALEVTEPGTLGHIVPGSWVNANFDVWIGAAEDNRAWDLLSDAHEFFTQGKWKPTLDPEPVDLAQEELWIAEGSDWNWWYGPEHFTPNDEEFDLLYRKHLSNIYRLLGGSPPDELAVPIKRPRAEALNVPPSGKIEPRIDGVVTNYFEWLGAGVYSPAQRAGAMHGMAGAVDVMYYGYSDRALYLRLDFNKVFLQQYTDFEIRVNLGGESHGRLQADVRASQLEWVKFGRGDQPMPSSPANGRARAALSRIFEIGFDYDLLAPIPPEKFDLQVSLWVNDLPIQVIPQEGWLTVEIIKDLAGW